MSYNPKNLISTITKLQENFINKKPINVLFCDIQDYYIKKIYKSNDIIRTAEEIAEASKILGLNQIVTEHKKEVFGPTIKEIKNHFYEKTILFEKTRFPMLDDEFINNQDKDAVYVLFGIEAHICVTQTAVNILKNDKPLILLADGISSTNPGDRELALKNLQAMGAYLTSTQGFLFLLLRDVAHPNFKSLLHIFKSYSNRDNSILYPFPKF